jgi:hypothetical protein
MNLIWIRNVFLTSVITLTLLYLVLLAFEVFVATSRAVPQYKIENNFDLRTAMEVVSDMRKEGKEVYPAATLNFWMGESLVSLGGISNVDIVNCNELGQYAVYRSDRYGFNNYDYVYDKEIDAVLIGDSFAQGACVKQNESIMGNLNRMGLATISLGTRGNGPLREYASYKEYVNELEPEYVLWLYFEGNDLYGDLQREKSFELLRKYLDDDGFSQNLSNNRDKIDNYIKEHLDDRRAYGFHKFIMRIRSAVKLTDLRTVISNFAGSPILLRLYKNMDQETKDLFEQIILKANSATRQKGERFIFVYLPAYTRYTNSGYKNLLDFGKEYVIGFLKENNIEHLDFDEVISGHKDPLEFFPYREFGHYNPFGYQVLSNEIYNYIKAE